jgi:hypothetical protein
VPTIQQLAAWLEEDGHAGCAEDLMCAVPHRQPAAARKAADCMEQDPDGYRDGHYMALIGELREWAAGQERGTGPQQMPADSRAGAGQPPPVPAPDAIDAGGTPT